MARWNRKCWSAAEDDIVRAHLSERTPRRVIYAALPARSENAIDGRCKKLGSGDGKKPWSEVERTLLAELHAQGIPSGSIAARFPERTLAAVRYKLNILSVARARPPAPPSQSMTPLPEPATITAWLCGDPLPGRSALDLRPTAARRSAITLPGMESLR